MRTATGSNNFRPSNSSPYFVNLDSDDDLEIVVGHDTNAGQNLLYYNFESGSYVDRSGSSPLPRHNFGHAPSPVLIDADGDNDLDLLVGNSAGQIILL